MATVLPDRALVLLRYGDVEGSFAKDGSRVVGSIVMSAVNAGCNREYVHRLLADPQHRGGFCTLRRRRNLDAWFDREWRRAVAKVKASPAIGDRNEATVVATELMEQADRMRWTGVGGGTDRVVYTFALTVAARTGRLSNLALSVREVGENARVGRETAGKSLHRLATRGLLRCTSPSKGKEAAVWEVRQNPDTLPHTRHPYVGPVCPGGVTPPTDVWRYKGLGHSTERIHALLSEDALSAQCIATAFGVTKRTVQRHLAKLAAFGLAERTSDGWIRGNVEPVELEEDLGVKGMTEKQHNAHQHDRDQRAQAMARHAAQESAPFVVDPETGEILYLAEMVAPPIAPPIGLPTFARTSAELRRDSRRTHLQVAA